MSLFQRKVKDLVGTRSDSYGHSSSGYGHSSSGYGGHSGSYSSGYHDDCCPLVVDPLTLVALLSFLAAATFLLNQQISMSNLMVRRKRENRKTRSQLSEILHFGKFYKK